MLYGFNKKDRDRTGKMLKAFERGGVLPGRRKRPMQSRAAVGMFIAKVDSDAAGGGYYNCHLQIFDATDWGTDTDPFEQTGDSVVVLNIAEVGSSVHNLDAGDYIIGEIVKDDEGNAKHIGNEVIGRHTFGEW